MQGAKSMSLDASVIAQVSRRGEAERHGLLREEQAAQQRLVAQRAAKHSIESKIAQQNALLASIKSQIASIQAAAGARQFRWQQGLVATLHRARSTRSRTRWSECRRSHRAPTRRSPRRPPTRESPESPCRSRNAVRVGRLGGCLDPLGSCGRIPRWKVSPPALGTQWGYGVSVFRHSLSPAISSSSTASVTSASTFGWTSSCSAHRRRGQDLSFMIPGTPRPTSARAA